MQISWQKTDQSAYDLILDGVEVKGSLRIEAATLECRATFQLGPKAYTIRRTGFWPDKLEIADQAGAIILKVYPKNWYGNRSILEYDNKVYELFIHNNPLAEWVIADEDTLQLAYGLDAGTGKVGLKITAPGEQMAQNWLLHALLWYLFVPIASENTTTTLLDTMV